jgi:transposase
LRPGELVGPLAAAKRALRSLDRLIQALDAEHKELLADLDGLNQAACPGLRQSYGIGIDGAAVLLVAVGGNPERIRSEAAYAAICGASPLQASSYTSRHHRLNRSGNRQANVTLHLIAVERLRSHELTKAYAERCNAEGFSSKDIPRCYKWFIVSEAFDLLIGKPPRRAAAT